MEINGSREVKGRIPFLYPHTLVSAASLQSDAGRTRHERRCYDRGASDDTPTK
jgi:hypothetical protein